MTGTPKLRKEGSSYGLHAESPRPPSDVPHRGRQIAGAQRNARQHDDARRQEARHGAGEESQTLDGAERGTVESQLSQTSSDSSRRPTVFGSM